LFPNFRYFNAPLASVESDILEIECLKLPILVTIAKDYLTEQASSVSAERSFSSGTDLVTADWCSLWELTILILLNNTCLGVSLSIHEWTAL
jgi:hypothetical protein